MLSLGSVSQGQNSIHALIFMSILNVSQDLLHELIFTILYLSSN